MRFALGKITLRVINAKYSVSTWLWLFLSFIVAMFLLLTIIAGTSPGLAEFDKVMPFNGPAWSGGLVLASIVKAVGIVLDKDRLIRYGALGAFSLWAFGLFTFALLGQLQAVFFLILPIMIFNVYLFLVPYFRTNKQA